MNIVLKNKRESERLTQEEVARISNVSLRAYQNYEAGLRIPNVESAIRIAKALGETVEKIFVE